MTKGEQLMTQIIRVSVEISLWAITLTLVTTLTGCDEQTKEPGAQQECVLTNEGDVCRTPDGISQK
jgi:hypothetical protein